MAEKYNTQGMITNGSMRDIHLNKFKATNLFHCVFLLIFKKIYLEIDMNIYGIIGLSICYFFLTGLKFSKK